MAPRLMVHGQDTSLGTSPSAEADLNRALELLAEVKSGATPPMLRLYRPLPTVAFGQRDANLPGFEAACAAAEAHGFAPVVRRAGGRAAAYHRGCLVVDHIQRQPDAIVDAKARFGFFADLFTTALRSLGVDARVGEIPGEYCPGEYSVHGIGAGLSLKLVGTAQRVVSGAWLFSTVIVVADSAPIRSVLVDCYRALGLDWDPATAGAVDDLVPGLGVDTVEAAVLEAYRPFTELVHTRPFESQLGRT
ncbi:lipoate--protein ligase family protein [Specibacter cremeus]|uniref:lipoate--protein ligase family protein n=1 Tax=Specibacter cremeus TaxID=1629051 RepID=UPI000F76DDC3|nr:lipoate--protein ligase family protein [Specibacter cremeus]